MNAESLYDDFGNYIGPELASDESEEDIGETRTNGRNYGTTIRNTSSFPQDNGAADLVPADPSSAVILAEDKEYFATAEEVFGPDTEALVEEEDTQPLSEPLVARRRKPVTLLTETRQTIPTPLYDYEYFAAGVLSTPSLCRNIALVGSIHHGKTLIADLMFSNSHNMLSSRTNDRPLRYMDARPDEQQLEVSLKMNAASLLLQSMSGKSYGLTVLDAPGHPNFADEAVAAMNMADGVVAVVDSAEGIGLGTDILLRKAALLRLDIVLVLSKIDRLILELRLPPSDAYHKIRHTIDLVNDIVVPLGSAALSPAHGNVAFSSGTEQICFTLQQFANVYISKHGGPLSAVELSKRFWGDTYYDKETRSFSEIRPSTGGERTFVDFVLLPLYKLHSAVVSDDVEMLSQKLSRNGISLSSRSLKVDVRDLLRNVMSSAFGLGSTGGLVDMIVKFIRAPDAFARQKAESMGVSREEDGNEEWTKSIEECRTARENPMIGYVGKLMISGEDSNADSPVEFLSLFRVMSGQIRVGDHVRVLGDSYSLNENEEEQARAVVSGIFIPCARFKIEVSRAVSGQIVLVKGIDGTIFKSATVVSASHPACANVRVLRPLAELLTPGIVKIAVEPIRPAELPKMVAGLRMCLKSFPGLTSKVEESGEHTLLGAGELYMDCVMRDLRETFAGIQVKVSDPVVPFQETVIESSALLCHAETPNKQNKITMMAEPLEEAVARGLAEDRFTNVLEQGKDEVIVSTLKDLGWDALASRSLWSFGPHPTRGPNALVNDILDPSAKTAASVVRDSVVQGFNWAVREGPLTDEPVRGVKFRLLEATFADSATQRSPAQLIPAVRRAAYSSMLTASARLLEPVYLTETTCPRQALNAVHTILRRRRGTVVSENSVPGTSLCRVQGLVPVLDSFGLESDIRGVTLGSAFCVQVFDHWAVMPGDPLDRGVVLRPLEPAGRHELARECMVKTRRRKGMPDDVSILKYFDDPLLVELARDIPELNKLL